MSLPTIVTRDTKKVFTYRNTKFWAERGFINMVAERKDGEHTKINLTEWMARLRAFRAEYNHMVAINWPWKDELLERSNLVQDMEKAAKHADAQGDITNAAVAGYFDRHFAASAVSMASTTPAGLILPPSCRDPS